MGYHIPFSCHSGIHVQEHWVGSVQTLGVRGGRQEAVLPRQAAGKSPAQELEGIFRFGTPAMSSSLTVIRYLYPKWSVCLLSKQPRKKKKDQQRLENDEIRGQTKTPIWWPFLFRIVWFCFSPDFEIENGSFERVVVLFERCVIACALYEEFWQKWVIVNAFIIVASWPIGNLTGYFHAKKYRSTEKSSRVWFNFNLDLLRMVVVLWK